MKTPTTKTSKVKTETKMWLCLIISAFFFGMALFGWLHYFGVI